MKFDDVTFPLPQKIICSVLEDLIRNSGLTVPKKKYPLHGDTVQTTSIISRQGYCFKT